MDNKKIGKFIMNERKEQNLTQSKLASKLFVSDKTVSKWENGNGLPDASIIPELCKILNCSINELFNGERINGDDYARKAEEKLLELQQGKQNSDKGLLWAGRIIGLCGALFWFVCIFGASFLEMPTYLRIVLISAGAVVFWVSVFFALRIEQTAGYYQCAKCGHKYIPRYKDVVWSMHMGTTRYMKCPKCNQKSWNKKVVE